MSDITDHLVHLSGIAQRCRSCAADLYAYAGSPRLIKKMLGIAVRFEQEAARATRLIGPSDEIELVWGTPKSQHRSLPVKSQNGLITKAVNSKRIDKALAFRKTLRSRRNADNKGVTVIFLGDDSKEHEISFAIQCVPVTIAALVNEYARVLSVLPSPVRPTAQAIKGTGIVPAIGADGMPALIIGLKGGGELTIEFPKAAMTDAAARIAEILIALREGRFH